jgi:hypothetical protein
MSEVVEIAMSELTRAVLPGLTLATGMSLLGHRFKRLHRAWHGSCVPSSW